MASTGLPAYLLSSVRNSVQTDLVYRVRAAAEEGIAGAGNGVQALAAAFAARLGNRNDMKKIHEQVATVMRVAVLEAYDANVANNKTNDYGSRESPARDKGNLRPALESPTLAVGTARGIDFVDINRIFDQAHHIYRLNFGTQGEGQQEPGRPVPVQLFGAVLFEVSFNEGLRPGFSIPKGLFKTLDGEFVGASADRRGLDAFFPVGELPTASLKSRGAARRERPAKAIVGRQFLEAGLYAMAEELPFAYDRLVQGWLKQGNEAAEAYLGKIVLRGGRVPKNLGAKSLRVTA